MVLGARSTKLDLLPACWEGDCCVAASPKLSHAEATEPLALEEQNTSSDSLDVVQFRKNLNGP